MATIVYKNAKMFVDDTQIDSQLTELAVNYKAEMLDVTTFGNDYRIKAGGLKLADIQAKGFFDGSGVTQIDGLLFRDVGVDDAIFTMFPDGIVEGSVSNFGYAMKGVVESLSIGGAVGTMLPLSLSAQSRAINQ
jgi:hypothetical protein